MMLFGLPAIKGRPTEELSRAGPHFTALKVLYLLINLSKKLINMSKRIALIYISLVL